MGRLVALIVGLVVTLALLTWGASAIVRSATLDWFDRDLTSRAELAASGARSGLLRAWLAGRPEDVTALLDGLIEDERVIAAAACDTTNAAPVSATHDFPPTLPCSRLRALVSHGNGPESWRMWSGRVALPSTPAHVTVLPVRADQGVLGVLAIVHDVSYTDEREAATQRFLLIAFGILAVTTSIITAVAGRVPWRRWSEEFRRALFDGDDRQEFRFVMRDVRALAERIAAERDVDRDVEAWTPQRLRELLTRHLERDQVLIVANREPYIHERVDDRIRVVRPASGLVTALEPVMRACSGVWIAHGSGTADRETADRDGRLRVPPGDESYTLRRVWLTKDIERGYYYGFANEGLWPLCHIAHTRPTFRTEDWRGYQEANERFADAAAAESTTDSPIVLVQDYHFGLLPRLIRERLPRATVLMFWHIPWPNSERFGICPQREALLDGMLGADILGFHTQADCNNFIDTADRYLEARIDRELHAIVQQGRRTFVRPYPISISWPAASPAGGESVAATRASVFQELGLRPTAQLGVGVDRLDYTKGIEERLLAVERLLDRFPDLHERFTFAQFAAPSRTAIDRYRRLNDDVEALAARINDKYRRPGYQPIILKRAHYEPPMVYRYYRAADLCYVSSLHDGMNLVAKEFVAARDDEDGVLVLSQFTGAARELTEALIVNPYDLDQASDALAAALLMPAAERRVRMHHMRTHLAEFNVYRWAGRMLLYAARLRRTERLPSRLVASSGVA
jgi:trehalose 6-phosphate synthase